MSVGSRIRRVRKFRDMTQKELGIALGYDEKVPMFVLLNMKLEHAHLK